MVDRRSRSPPACRTGAPLAHEPPQSIPAPARVPLHATCGDCTRARVGQAAYAPSRQGMLVCTVCNEGVCWDHLIRHLILHLERDQQRTTWTCHECECDNEETPCVLLCALCDAREPTCFAHLIHHFRTYHHEVEIPEHISGVQ